MSVLIALSVYKGKELPFRRRSLLHASFYVRTIDDEDDEEEEEDDDEMNCTAKLFSTVGGSFLRLFVITVITCTFFLGLVNFSSIIPDGTQMRRIQMRFMRLRAIRYDGTGETKYKECPKNDSQSRFLTFVLFFFFFSSFFSHCFQPCTFVLSSQMWRQVALRVRSWTQFLLFRTPSYLLGNEFREWLS